MVLHDGIEAMTTSVLLTEHLWTALPTPLGPTVGTWIFLDNGPTSADFSNHLALSDP